MTMHGYLDRGSAVPRGRFGTPGRFGRLFPYLRSLRTFEPGPVALGQVGGRMDGGSPPPSDTSQDNPRTRAGYTFVGQFVDHDLTFDPTSVLEQQIDPQATVNFRTPVLELDSVYGQGPNAQPYLYDRTRPGRFLVDEVAADASGPVHHDLPRNSQGRALIGDPRNDENTIVSQLHTLFLRWHNTVFEEETSPTAPWQQRFEEAQHLVRWHYQWLVVHELLARLVGQPTVDRVLTHQPLRFADEAFMPVEFSVAAYRFGHSQVRPGYALSAPGTPGRGALLFPPGPGDPDGPGDLRGGRPVPKSLRVDWGAFFGPQAQASKRIDPRISTTLLRLPFSVVGPQPPGASPDDPMVHSLATRNLQRGIDARLPSGQAVARHLCVDVLDESELWDGVTGGRGPAPLWFYLLREAEVRTQGHMLAGVGAEIVAGVMAAVLEADKASYVVQDPYWTPTLGGTPGRFTFSDLVAYVTGEDIGHEEVGALPTGLAPGEVVLPPSPRYGAPAYSPATT